MYARGPIPWPFVVPVLIGVFAGVAAKAQETPATQPEVNFVAGPAVTPDWGHVLPRSRVVAAFATRPQVILPTNPKGARDFVERVISNLYGPSASGIIAGAGPDRVWYADNQERIAISRKLVYGEQGIDRDVWTILAQDDETARRATAALLATGREVAAETLAQARAAAPEKQERLEAAQSRLEELQAGAARAEDETRAAGVASLPDDAIDSAVARFDQERRLNDVDITGIEAALKNVRERYGKPKEPVTLPGPVADTLGRLQVELEIQLVGKLARKEALAGELARLQTGRDARRRATELRQQSTEQETAVAERRRGVDNWQGWVNRWQKCAAELAPVDNLVTLSPVAEPMPPVPAPTTRP